MKALFYALFAVLFWTAVQLSAQVPQFNVSVPPVVITPSWHNYMISAYCSLPMQEIPAAFGGGRVMTYHATRTTQSNRKVYFTYINDSGQMQTVVDPWQDTNRYMGYPSMAMDRTLGKPFYAWHEAFDADDPFEVSLFYENSPAVYPAWYSPLQQVFDPPMIPAGHESDEFIWPMVRVGPSPNPGMRRVYVLGMNAEYNNLPVGNVLIAYADYNDTMLSNMQSLNWTYTTIPVLDDWHNNDEPIYRRMFGSFAVGNDGKIYYAGSHITWDEVNQQVVDEPDLDVFVNDNFGEGPWQHFSFSSKVPSYNPWNAIQMRYAFYNGSDPEVPVPDDEIYYYICDTGHFNVVIDADGKLHIPGIWTLRIGEATYRNHETSTIKEVVFDPFNASIQFREIFPIAGDSSDNLWWMPWDADGDHEADSWPATQLQPECTFHFPFCHWDNTLHFDAMYFQYNYVRLSEDDASGAMVCLWQDSYKARCYNLHPDEYPEYAAFEDSPEIYLAISFDRGQTWREPIILSAVDTPELNGMIPMWVYPSDRFTDISAPEGSILKRLYLMFMDENYWGAIIPPEHGIDQGNIMYMAMDINPPVSLYPESESIPVPALQLAIYPNPFNPSTTLKYTVPSTGQVRIGIYNIRGQLVQSLVDESRQAGTYSAVWKGDDFSGRQVASGVYFCRVEASGCTISHKLMMIK